MTDQFVVNVVIESSLSRRERSRLGLFLQRDAWLREQVLKLPDINNAPAASRGWICQERLLSPRVLHYTSAQLYFECRFHLIAEEGLPVDLLTRPRTLRLLQHSAHFRDKGCRFWLPLTPFLTPLAPRSSRRMPRNLMPFPSPPPLAGLKYREPKMYSHSLRSRSVNTAASAVSLQGPLQLQIRAPPLTSCFLLLFPTAARQSATHLLIPPPSHFLSPIKGHLPEHACPG
jgi:hypothetical protein